MIEENQWSKEERTQSKVTTLITLKISSKNKKWRLNKLWCKEQDIPLMQHHESKEGLGRSLNNRGGSGRMVDLSNSENVQILSKSK